MKGLAGKVALVTGASRGIGLGIAQRLVDEGAKVCVTARKPEALEEAVAALGGPEHAIAVAGKADDPEHRADAVRRTVEAFGSLDLLVNNAGINPVAGPLIATDLGAARKTVEVNALGPLAWLQAAHAAWMGEHGGAVVNISSLSGVRSAPGIAMYGASKAMLISLTESLAAELGPTIRVNAVAPAVVKTDFASLLFEGREEEVAAAYPLKRLGVPADVAGAVAYLLSDDASWVTGQTLVIDGGVDLASH
ncbi:SDR family oxidoreductase [Nocardioides mangrovi]|uniref:SDR family oxidoreductase n=1 Tax=Nocardioides mangrovi TaxID=2874580 RepID=A0ABS7UF87_9ACTN|nr:SDR family oxidoreductase [Nocardioides mangrovi]MBZ5739674.1 SDR family oxidoreductase [Nocardioides mangrovi]